MRDNNPFEQALDDPFGIQGIADSRTTHARTQPDTEAFEATRHYIQGILNTWDLSLGFLPFSSDNNITIKTILQLVSWRQKDMSFRQKVKQQISVIKFEKSKCSNQLQQARITLQEKNRQIGRMQNQLTDLQQRIKKQDQSIKKQRQEDKKLIAMLKSKNEQILHEVKKKEQQSHKLAQQLKRQNRSQRTSNLRSSLEVIQKFPTPKGKIQEDKSQFLIQKFQNEKKIFLRENLLLREKLYDIRQEIVNFAEWVDQQIFGLQRVSYQNKFIINHNLLFKKQSLVDELKEIISSAKDGIKQIMESNQAGTLRQSVKPQNNMSKKASTGVGKTISQQPYYLPEQSDNNKKKKQSNNSLVLLNNHKKKKDKQTPPQSVIVNQQSQIQEKSSLIHDMNFDHEHINKLMDEIDDSDISIISHVSMKQLDKKPFEKWDILFKND